LESRKGRLFEEAGNDGSTQVTSAEELETALAFINSLYAIEKRIRQRKTRGWADLSIDERAERGHRGIAIGRKNWTMVGSNRGKAVQSSANCLTPWCSPPGFLSTTVITIGGATTASQSRSGSTAAVPERCGGEMHKGGSENNFRI
jgi:hypothetical protein